MDLTQCDLNEVLEDFLVHRFRTVDIYADADRDFFQRLVGGAARRQAEIDALISANLAQGWKLSRIDSILRAILRAAVYELIGEADVPARAIVNEYVEIAHDFFGGEEPSVVNGILDRVARARRAREFGRRGPRKEG
jgi:N utilization substance protein B